MTKDSKGFQFDDFLLSPSQKCLFRTGKLVQLTPTEYQALYILLSSAGEVVFKERLYRALWPDGDVEDNNLVHHIGSLRRKIGSRPDGTEYIATVRGLGYRFAKTISADEEATPAPPSPSPVAGPKVEIPGPSASGVVVTRWNGRKTAISWIAFGMVAGLVIGLSLDTPIQRWAAASSSKSQMAPVILTTVNLPQGEIGGQVRFIKTETPPNAIVSAAGGTELYACEPEGQSVEVIDPKSEKVVKRIPVGPGPAVLVASPDGRKVYIGRRSGGFVVIDVSSHTASLFGAFKGTVEDMAITHDGSSAYLALGYLGVGKLDLKTGAVTILSKRIYAKALALSQDGSRFYISYQGGGPGGRSGHDAIGYFSTSTGKLAGTIKGFANVGACLTVSPDNTQVWECGADACDSPQYDHVGCPAVPAGLINIIDTKTNKLRRSVAVRGTRVECTNFTPDGDLALVATIDRFLLISPRDLSIVDSVPADSWGRIALSKSDDLAFVPLMNKSAIEVVPLTIPVQAFQLTRSQSPDGRLSIAVISAGDFDAKILDPNTLRLGQTPVARDRSGLPCASIQSVTGFDRLNLIVQFDEKRIGSTGVFPLTGKTYGGMPIRGTVDLTQ